MERPSFIRQDTDASFSGEKTSGTSTGISSAQSFDSKSLNEKGVELNVPPAFNVDSDEERLCEVGQLETAEDIVTAVIHLEDDPTLSPWTFRMFFIGFGLSAFGSVLQEIFYFKPTPISVSVMFLTVIAYALGEFMSLFIPRWGRIGRFLNPFQFNRKEHTAIVLMASAASVSALSTEALAVQKLFYGGYPNQAAGVFVTLSSQLIGYGIAGMMRETLVWPSKMLYPSNLPVSTVLETLHQGTDERKKRLKVFWIVFSILLVWEIVPEYIFPLLIGFSVFCLANQNSLFFTNLFGGAQGNEGLGVLSLCFDWNYIAGLGSPLWMPLQTMNNSFIGYVGCIIMFTWLYYGNIWRSLDFPFLSQLLFNTTSNSTQFVQYNESLIFNADFIINQTALEKHGIPYLSGTYVGSTITSNTALTATIVHMFLWNYREISLGWAFINRENLRKITIPSTYFFWKKTGTRSHEERQAILDDPSIDPHYKVMVDYDETPDSWYFVVFAVSFITAMVCLYVMKSTLPWWGLIIGFMFVTIFILFFGAQYAITGFGLDLQSFFQMLAGYMFPGRPLANMYFTTFTYSALSQGEYLLSDLKLAQRTKLSPKAAFTTQVMGCVVGAFLNYAMMINIVKQQAAILVSVEGTSIWSGVNVQQFNTLSIAWSIAPKMFGVGSRYQWVTISYLVGFLAPLPFYILSKLFPRMRIWPYLNTAIILGYMGYLFFGINSSVWVYYLIGYFGQFYLRKYRPKYFVKWNYLVSAAMDGGTQVMVFLLTFTVFWGGSSERPFPLWAGNHPDNVDYCAYNPANG